MTTTTTNTLPDFEGASVSRAAIKIAGAGTGLSEGLKVSPIVLDVGDEAVFVLRARCVGVEHSEDKNELLVRVHKLHTEEMAPIDEAVAGKALREYAAAIERQKEHVDGQLAFDQEQEALDREARDATDSPAEIAQAAAERAKS